MPYRQYHQQHHDRTEDEGQIRTDGPRLDLIEVVGREAHDVLDGGVQHVPRHIAQMDVEACGTRIIMRQVRDAIAEVLDRTTLSELLRQMAAARSGREKKDALMYHI